MNLHIYSNWAHQTSKMHLTKRILVAAFLIVANTGSIVAQESPSPQKQSSESATKYRGHTELLQDLLAMSDNELTELRTTIERIENMSSEEKDELRQRIHKINKMNPDRVGKLRKKYKDIPPETRKAMRKRWSKLTREERIAWRKKLKTLSPKERQKALEEAKLLPPSFKKKGPKKEIIQGGE